MISKLPTLHAILNSAAACFLVAGYFSIKKRRVYKHRFFMLTAFCLSILFLVSYLYYHAQVGTVHFQGSGWLRTFYLAILSTHTPLAAMVPFLASLLIYRAHRGEFARHRKLARIALPIWLYVAVTGVVIYWMLYVLRLT